MHHDASLLIQSAGGVPQANGLPMHQQVQVQDPYVLQVGGAPMGDEYGVNSGHRLMQAAGNRGGPTGGVAARPKTIFG